MTDQSTDQMPVFTIKGKDRLALATIEHYRFLCDINGLTEQAAEVAEAIAEIEQWQYHHIEAVKMPDHKHVPAGEDHRG